MYGSNVEILLPLTLLFIAALALASYAVRRRRNAIQSVFFVTGRVVMSPTYLCASAKPAPDDALCAICLAAVTDEQYGQTSCCDNYLHVRCVAQYQHSGAASSSKCCLCQQFNGLEMHTVPASV